MSAKFPGLEASQARYDAIKKQFPRVTNGGIDVVRKIKNSSKWSQHSWGNAVDVMIPSLAYGDEVKRFVDANKSALNIGLVLWRVPDHYDHLHIEGPSQYTGTPPAKGGTVQGGAGNRTPSGNVNPVTGEPAEGQGGLDITAPFDAVAGIGDFLGMLVKPDIWLRAIFLGLGLGATVAGVGIFIKELTGVDPLAALAGVVKATPQGAAASGIAGALKGK